MRPTSLFKSFFDSEKSGGLVLICATIFSLIFANSSAGPAYIAFWNISFGGYTIVSWINDGLMAIFFLLIGLELEREIYLGELSGVKRAALPCLGALGGMLVPVVIYFAFNAGTPEISGAGIPMATDIAFAVGILSLIGSRVPASLKIFLTALAVIDDLGAIIVIAAFYTASVSFAYLIASVGIWIALFLMNRLKVRSLLPYLAGGMVMWYFMLKTGIHPTIAGVMLAFVIPFGNGRGRTASTILQQNLHKPVAFIILPLFALANTAFLIDSDWPQKLLSLSGIGILCGLTIGKPLGIFAFSYFGNKLKLCTLPDDMRWEHLFGAAMLGGVGFTMSIFITLLAFDQANLIEASKIAVMVSSVLAAILGFATLKIFFSKKMR